MTNRDPPSRLDRSFIHTDLLVKDEELAFLEENSEYHRYHPEVDGIDDAIDVDEILAGITRESIDRDISVLEVEQSELCLDDDLIKMVYHRYVTFDEAVRAQKIRNENSG